MILRRSRHNDPDLNLTPLIDVVFLLLIFFMVSTTFEKESEISIELPEASGQVSEDERFTIEVSIDAEGRYFVNNNRLRDDSLDNLMRAMREVRADHQAPRLVISADKNTPHQAVVQAMDAARQLGLVHLTFATRQSERQ